MEVILKEDVPKLGNRGEVVKVAEGYGRNFLLPKKLAIEATIANKSVVEQMKAASVRRSAKEKTEAEEPGKSAATATEGSRQPSDAQRHAASTAAATASSGAPSILPRPNRPKTA